MIEKKLIFYRRKSFWFICGLPSLAVGLYTGVMATPRFESESVVKVYSASDQTSSGGASAAMGGSGAAPGNYVLQTYVNGYDCLTLLDIPALRKHWSGGDIISGFGGVSSFFGKNDMRLWDYYRSHVNIGVDETTNTVRLNVDGYSSDFVHGLNNKILSVAAEELRQSGVKAYKADIEMLTEKTFRDKSALSEALARMQDIQKKSGIADYDEAYKALLLNISTFLESKISVESKVAASGFLASQSQQLEALRAQVRSIDKSIADQNNEMSEKLAPVYATFTEAQARIKELSSVILLDDQSLLEAQERAIQNAYYIDFIEKPVTPSDPTEPRFVKWFLLTLVVTYILYAVFRPPASV